MVSYKFDNDLKHKRIKEKDYLKIKIIKTID